MSGWIGDKAVEASQALAGDHARLKREVIQAHQVLDAMKAPNALRGNGVQRTLTLPERIQALGKVQ